MVSAVIGIAQFLRIPGFAALQAYYSPLSTRLDFWGDAPNLYRAVGLTMHPYVLAAQCIFGMALIGSNLLQRKLFPQEIFSFVIFLGALFVAQSRAYYASALLLLIVVLVLMYRRDKVVFFSSIAAMAVCGILIVTVFPKRLEYGFRGSTLTQSGRLERWDAPIRAVHEFPLSGVGPNQALFGNEGRNAMLENRRRLEYPENGYRMVLGTMGLPGLSIMLAGLFGSLFLAVKVVRNRSAELLQRRMAFVGGLYVVSILIALNITNLFENELLTYLGVCTAAICLPDVGKAFQSVRSKRRLGYGFANGPEPETSRS
jgi:O-antigen ligase